MGVNLINQVVNWDAEAAIKDGKPIERPVTKAALKAVAFALANRANDMTRKCWPSEKVIARDMGLSVRTVERAVKWFHLNEYIDIERIHRLGRFRYNRYILLFKFKDYQYDDDSPTDPRSDSISPTDPRSLTNRPTDGLNIKETGAAPNHGKAGDGFRWVEDLTEQWREEKRAVEQDAETVPF